MLTALHLPAPLPACLRAWSGNPARMRYFLLLACAAALAAFAHRGGRPGL
jgi:hypothetical protein